MRVAMLCVGLLAGWLATPARAAEFAADEIMLDDYNFVERELEVDALKEYAVGVRRHQLDVQTRLLGWRLNDRWYLGRRKGDADGIGLIWQKGETQISLTPEGIGWRRQFSFR